MFVLGSSHAVANNWLQRMALPRAAALIHHGGIGTVTQGLAAEVKAQCQKWAQQVDFERAVQQTCQAIVAL